jgi:hypothetical protein
MEGSPEGSFYSGPTAEDWQVFGAVGTDLQSYFSRDDAFPKDFPVSRLKRDGYLFFDYQVEAEGQLHQDFSLVGSHDEMALWYRLVKNGSVRPMGWRIQRLPDLSFLRLDGTV